MGSLIELVDANHGLALAQVEGNRGGSRSLLHFVTDWPGYFPNGPAVVRVLLQAGADPNAAVIGGRHAETPLHWAAISDDVDVAEALIDGGANLDAPGGSIAGTPLGNSCAFGCWHVACLLGTRGARIDGLWQAAALGLHSRVEEFVAASPGPTSDEDQRGALAGLPWGAAPHGGIRPRARGGPLSPGYAKETPLDIAGSPDTREETVVSWLRELGAGSANP